MTVYAKGTEVPVAKSAAEIESLLMRYGAEDFARGWKSGPPSVAVVGFKVKGRSVQFTLPLPDKGEKRFRQHRGVGYGLVNDATAEKRWEQECRQRWRALCLVIKAKLEAVESGISTFESEFLANLIVPGTGRTIGQTVLPQLDEAYASGRAIALLPEHAE